MHGSSLVVLKGTSCLLAFFLPSFCFPLFCSLHGWAFRMFIVSAVFLLHHFDVLGWFFVPHFLLSGFLPPSLLTELQCAFTFMFAADCFLFLLFSQPPLCWAACKHADTPLSLAVLSLAALFQLRLLRRLFYGFLALALAWLLTQPSRRWWRHFFFRARLGEVSLSEWAQTFADPCACFFFDLSLCFAT